MILEFDDKRFMKDMNNFIQYSLGFFDGVELGKPQMMKKLAEEIQDLLGEYIDSSARVNPAALQHMYEWYQNGSSAGRLFNINYSLVGNGIVFGGEMTQSMSVRNGSNTPFYNKAKVMESGKTVNIRPKNSDYLVFEKDGETVFTKKPVTVTSPGGELAEGSFERTFKEFFQSYLSQSLLSVSGIMDNLAKPTEFKTDMRRAKSGGRAAGVSAGKKWVTKGI